MTACRNAENFEEFREEGRRRVHRTVMRDEVKDARDQLRF